MKRKDIFLKLFYPEKCMLCDKVLEVYQNGVCNACYDKLPLIRGSRCLSCSKPVYNNTPYCKDCTSVNHVYTQGYALWRYNKETREIISKLKYGYRREYIKYLAEELAYFCNRSLKAWGASALLPVPLHRSKYRKRGFNQADLLAKAVGSIVNLPVVDDLLYREKNTSPQKYYDNKSRRNNVEDAFLIDKHILAKYKKLNNIVIVDDIYTTGSTIDSCAAELKKAGISNIYFICLCIGSGY